MEITLTAAQLTKMPDGSVVVGCPTDKITIQGPAARQISEKYAELKAGAGPWDVQHITVKIQFEEPKGVFVG